MLEYKNKYPFKVTIPLQFAQTISAFNDNALKATLPLLAAIQFGKLTMDSVNQLVSILLIIPFVIFAPFAGWIADRFSKKRVISWALLGQLIGLVLLGFGLYIENLEFSLFGFFILSVQSAFFSPAKKGILKELVGSGQLGKAVGFMEMLAMVGILGGAFVGAYSFDLLVVESGAWNAALIICISVFLLAFLSWIISLPIPETDALKAEPFKLSLMISHFHDLRYLFRDRGIRYAALGDAWFWGMGGFFYLVLVKLSGEVTVGNVGMGSLYGYWFLLVGLGIMFGSIFVAYLNRGRIEIGLTSIGGLGVPVVFLLLYFAEPLRSVFSIYCFSLGFFGALFFVPLNGYLQDKAIENERGRILAASNLLTQLCGILLIFLHTFLSNVLNLNSKQEILVIFFPALLIGLFVFRSLFEDFFRALFHMVLRIFYRISIEGIENLPSKGGVLIVSNHLSYADPVFIGAAFSRKVRYLAYSGLAGFRTMRFVFRLTDTITISPDRSLDSMKNCIRKLSNGSPICVFAEGGISRIGTIFPFKRGIVLLAKKANVPILPVHIDRAWGSVFSISGGCFFKKWPKKFPYPITVNAGSLVKPEDVNPDVVRMRVMELGHISFIKRMPDKRSLQCLFKKYLNRNLNKTFFISKDGHKLTRGEILSFIQTDSQVSEELPGKINQWINQMKIIFEDVEGLPKIWSSYLRLQEINLWDQDGFSVKINSLLKPEWFLWIALLSERNVQLNSDGIIICKKTENKTVNFQTISGLSSNGIGLISINFKSFSELSGKSDELDVGYRANTLGRLLPGLSYKFNPSFSVANISGKYESIDIVKDMGADGFLYKA